VHEAEIERTPEGKVAAGDGWFVLNVGEMAWETVPGAGAWLDFGAPDADPRMGVHIHVLQPGEAFGYYHAEAAEEGFLVLSGECIAVIENEERRMRRWDYFYSAPGTAHVIVGAGDEASVILMFGSPDPTRKVEWIANETAARHGASVARTTGRDTEAYGEPLPEVVRVRAPSPVGDPPPR
jgi:uncharacterized cupin superfamily protein